MNSKTLKCMNDIVDYAREGNEIYPMFFSVSYGRATVGAAIRCAKKRGLLEQAGLDGVGQAKWQAVMPTATHATTATIQ